MQTPTKDNRNNTSSGNNTNTNGSSSKWNNNSNVGYRTSSSEPSSHYYHHDDRYYSGSSHSGGYRRDNYYDNRNYNRSNIDNVQSSNESIPSKYKDLSYNERIKIFKQMLEDCKVQIDDDYNRAMKRVGQDNRLKVLKRVQERKEIFYEYKDEKKMKEQEVFREKRRKLKIDFMNMLSELKDIIFTQNNSYLTTTYQQVLPKIENDHRFLNVENEDDRLDYFDEFIYEIERKEKEKIRNERNKNLELFQNLLEKRKEQGLINYKTLWRQLKDKLQMEDIYKKLDYCDRLIVWESFIKRLEQEHYEKKQLRKKEREKLEKLKFDRFWDLLIELHKNRKINVLSRWSEVKNECQNDERYLALANENISIPSRSSRNEMKSINKAKMVFKDFIDNYLVNLYKKDKKTFRRIIRDLNITIDENLSFDSFNSIIAKDERTNSIDPDNLNILFDESLEKSKEKKRKQTNVMEDENNKKVVKLSPTQQE